MIEIFTTLNKEISTLTSAFTTEVMQNIITNITPVVVAGLVLYFTVYGFLVFNQTIQQPLNSLLTEMFKIGIITSIALTGGIYQDKIADIIINIPEDFAKMAFNSSNDTFSVADQLITTGANKALEIISSASMLDVSDAIAKIFIGFIIGVSTVLIGAVGGGLLLLVKINCVILAAIGPLFIVALLFNQTRQLFSNWLSEIIGYGIFSLMLTVIFMFILKISEKYLSAIQDDENKLIATLVFLALVIVSAFLFFGCKSMAQRLSGVFSMGLAGVASDATGKFSQSAVKETSKKAGNYIKNKSTGWRKR
jgi:type IV secretion system protein VirB6